MNLCELHWRGVRLWVSAKDVSKVDVEEMSVCCDEQIVQMTVSDPKQICDDAVSCNTRGYDLRE